MPGSELLSSDTARALGLLLGFPHGVRHLDGDDLQAFVHWLRELIAWAETGSPAGCSPCINLPHRTGKARSPSIAGWSG